MKKILLNIAKYDYGIRENGLSFEYFNFYRIFKEIGHTVFLFDFASEAQKYGKDQMNRKLIKTIKQIQPDLLFSLFPPGYFTNETLKKILTMRTQSVIWMTDDEWMWDFFGKKICFYFSNVITTDATAVKKYSRIGYNQVILSQWGANTSLFKPSNIKKDIDVSFVGSINPWRKYLIEFLKNKGIPVVCYGTGWPNGRLDDQKMVEIFNRSKINLNISNSVQFDLGYLLTIFPPSRYEKGLIRKLYSIFGPQLHTLLAPKKNDQVKARLFEIAACQSFFLTHYTAGLERFYQINKEVVVYNSKNELVRLIKHYLVSENERETISRFAYLKTVNKYSYKLLFKKILDQIIGQ